MQLKYILALNLFTMRILLFFSLFCLANSCSKTDEATTVSGDAATIEYGEKVTFSDHGISLTFSNVSDGRCPCGSQCIIAGWTDVEISVTDNSSSESITLQSEEDLANNGSMNGTISAEKTVFGKKIKLLKVRPENCNDPKPDDYTVEVEIE